MKCSNNLWFPVFVSIFFLVMTLNGNRAGASLICGDVNTDSAVNVGDAVFVINYVFRAGIPPAPLYAGDANNDDNVNVGDAVYLINYIFRSGAEPQCRTFCGEALPGLYPEKFLPGILTPDYKPHGSLGFSVDGTELYWSAFLGVGWDQSIFYSLFDGAVISSPLIASFCEGAQEGGSAFSCDGSKLFFCAHKPVPGVSVDSCDAIWFVERTKSGWSVPQPVIATADTGRYGGQVSLSRSGNIYFCGRVKTETYPVIYRTVYAEGEYQQPVKLQGQINTALDQVDPYVDPDERFILFASFTLSGSLPKIYISYRQADSTWGIPIELENGVNVGANVQRFPTITRDGDLLFFARAVGNQYPSPETDFYWISSEILPPQPEG